MISTVLLVALSLFCGGWVKGVFGMGLPTVALGLLSLSMPPVEAATLIVIPTLATNAWQFMSGPEPVAVTVRFAILLIGVALGTALGVGFLTGSHIGLQREALIQAMGLVFMIAMLTLAACLAWTGHFAIASAGASALALLPVFAGMYAGQLVRLRLHADAYRKWFFIGLIGLGASSVIRALLTVGELRQNG